MRSNMEHGPNDPGPLIVASVRAASLPDLAIKDDASASSLMITNVLRTAASN
jgi:hypothetical protein